MDMKEKYVPMIIVYGHFSCLMRKTYFEAAHEMDDDKAFYQDELHGFRGICNTI